MMIVQRTTTVEMYWTARRVNMPMVAMKDALDLCYATLEAA